MTWILLELWSLWPTDSFNSHFWKTFSKKICDVPWIEASFLPEHDLNLLSVHYNSKKKEKIYPKDIWQLDKWFGNTLFRWKGKVLWSLWVAFPPSLSYFIRLKWLHCFSRGFFLRRCKFIPSCCILRITYSVQNPHSTSVTHT